ncbi:Alpha/Beta hydrolase protein [Xylariales sp. AK1849]|nr:Alpha/Beta hydrolase protein [Xylariales sp. AK1849]
MASQLPKTNGEILATGEIRPEFAAALKAKPIPPGSPYTIKQLKELSDATSQTERRIALPDGCQSRLLVRYRSDHSQTAKSALVVFFHGGGHCVGHPESEIHLACRLALESDAIVVLPCYRLAPENPVPASITDAWAIVQMRRLKLRVIVAGTSSGANLAASVAHIAARDQKLEPKLTGQLLIAGTFISPQYVPARYSSLYLAREQYKGAPIFDIDLDPGVKYGHTGLPPAYLQICGLDIGRDDSLIYERILREECGVETRASLYS